MSDLMVGFLLGCFTGVACLELAMSVAESKARQVRWPERPASTPPLRLGQPTRLDRLRALVED